MASADVTEDNEDTHVKSGFGRVLGMASVFGVSSAGQRLDRPSPIYSRFQLFDRGSSESVETSSARGWGGDGTAGTGIASPSFPTFWKNF